MIELKGKRALVTGGSQGIGTAITQTLAEHGADIATTYQNSAERADSVVSSVAKLGRHGLAIQTDNADTDAIKRAVNETVEPLGGLDIPVGSVANGSVANSD